MHRVICTGLLMLVLSALAPPAAPAQVKEAAIGGGVGFLGGAVITLGVVVARARFQRAYLDSVEDVIHWQTAPLILTPAAGVGFGLLGEDVLIGSIVGSTSGMAAGAVAGAGLGWLLSTEAEAPWAGGVIGAGAGMTIGGLLGAYLAWRDQDEDGEPEPAGSASYVGLRVRI